MFPKNCIIPGANPLRGARSSSDHSSGATAGVSYAGHTIGPAGDSGQMMPPSQGAFVQASEQQQRFMASTQFGAAGSQSQSTNPFTTEAFQAGMRSFEQGPKEFTQAQWLGIRTVLGGPMEGSLWLARRLAVLRNYELDFIIDNSLSMNQYDGMCNPETGLVMSRIEEAIYRLGNIGDLLSYIPVKGITLRTLSGEHTPVAINCQAPPHEISAQIKSYLEFVNTGPRTTNTPLFTALSTSLEENRNSPNPRIIYVLNDGMPNSGGGPYQVCDLLRTSRCGEKNPVCLIACTGDRESVAWMNDADRIIGNIHVIDDFKSEQQKIKAKHGENFPVTEGFYAMSSLLGAVDDLFDKADENHIYSHNHYQEIMGRPVSQAEYENYQTNARLLQQSSNTNREEDFTRGSSYVRQFMGYR